LCVCVFVWCVCVCVLCVCLWVCVYVCVVCVCVCDSKISLFRLPRDLSSVFQDLIPEIIRSRKCHIYVGLGRSIYGAVALMVGKGK